MRARVEPSSRTLSQSMAMRKLTTSRPEMMPMKMESSRKRRSSRAKLERGGTVGGGAGVAGRAAEEIPAIPASAGVADMAWMGGSGIYSCSTAPGLRAIRRRSASSPVGAPQTWPATVSVS
jgi:ribosome modulation factor